VCIYELHAHIDTCRRHVPSRPYYETHILSIRAKHVSRIGHGVCIRIRIYIQRCIKVNIHIYIYTYIHAALQAVASVAELLQLDDWMIG
jgi:hypothetical protein